MRSTSDRSWCRAALIYLPVPISCCNLAKSRGPGQSTLEAAYASKANDGSGETLGAALQAIGYVGDGPNTFEEFPISGHFEIHCEQQTVLEKANKPVGWVEGWQGIDYYEMVFTGEDGHANTYPMERRKDSLVGASKLIVELESLPKAHGSGYTTMTNIQSGPIGCCNIQSWTKLVFCLMNYDAKVLGSMGADITARGKAIAQAAGLGFSSELLVHLEPGQFWPEAVDCVKRACGDKGIGACTETAHDSTMTRLKCPTAMVFARGKDGVSHNAKEWTSKEDCAESALVLGKAVLNFDEILKNKK